MAYPYKAPFKAGAKKDDVWFPFGSLCGAWGMANHGKGVTAEELAKVAEVLFAKAVEIVKRQENEGVKPPVATTPFVPEIEL